MPTPGDLESRISTLEAVVSDSRKDIAELSASFERFSKSTRDDIASMSRTNWGTLIAAVSLTVMIIGAIGAAFMAPLKGAIASVETVGELNRAHQREVSELNRLHLSERSAKNAVNIEDVEKRISDNRTEMRALSEKFREVETQFRWGTDIDNSRFRNMDRLLAILWEKAFGVALPAASLPAVGPNHGNSK